MMLTHRERNHLAVQMFDAQRDVSKVAKANTKAIERAGLTSLAAALTRWAEASAKVSTSAKDEGDWEAFMSLEGFPDA